MPAVILALLVLCGKERFIKIKYVQIIYPLLILAINLRAVGFIIEFFI